MASTTIHYCFVRSLQLIISRTWQGSRQWNARVREFHTSQEASSSTLHSKKIKTNLCITFISFTIRALPPCPLFRHETWGFESFGILYFFDMNEEEERKLNQHRGANNPRKVHKDLKRERKMALNVYQLKNCFSGLYSNEIQLIKKYHIDSKKKSR